MIALPAAQCLAVLALVAGRVVRVADRGELSRKQSVLELCSFGAREVRYAFA